MSTIQRMTLIGMYNYDSTLFDNVSLPEGYDKDTFINSLLLEHGEKCVMYTDVDFMKFSLGVVSRKWYHEFERIYTALNEEYNPLHNYDRHEEYKDITERKAGGKVTTTQPEDTTEETRVAAYNSASYEPDRKSFSNAGKVVSENENGENGTLTHDAHLYGNIGVTTSAAMALEETRLRSDNNMYGVIADIFSKEVLLQLY